jgi:hypothetical protein
MTHETMRGPQPRHERRASDVNGVAATPVHAAFYDEHFAVVYEIASRLAGTESEAAEITNASFKRWADGALVTPKADERSRLVATAYHEAAVRGDRATQPVAAGTHGLEPELVDAVNAHVARCRSCRRWGELPPSSQPGVRAPYPDDMKRWIWIALSKVLYADGKGLRRAGREPSYIAPGWVGARRVARQGDRNGLERRWMFALTGVAAALIAVVVGTARLVSSGGDGGEDSAGVSADASSDRTPLAGGAVPRERETATPDAAPEDVASSSSGGAVLASSELPPEDAPAEPEAVADEAAPEPTTSGEVATSTPTASAGDATPAEVAPNDSRPSATAPPRATATPPVATVTPEPATPVPPTTEPTVESTEEPSGAPDDQGRTPPGQERRTIDDVVDELTGVLDGR